MMQCSCRAIGVNNIYVCTVSQKPVPNMIVSYDYHINMLKDIVFAQVEHDFVREINLFIFVTFLWYYNLRASANESIIHAIQVPLKKACYLRSRHLAHQRTGH